MGFIVLRIPTDPFLHYTPYVQFVSTTARSQLRVYPLSSLGLGYVPYPTVLYVWILLQ